jgi:hypothetical protein
MHELFTAFFGFPGIILTVLMGVVVLYWGMVIFGVFDIDFGGGIDGATEGAAEAALEGAAEGAAEAALEGTAEGATEAALEGAAEGATEAALEGVAEGAAEGAAEAATEGVAEAAAEGATEGVAEGATEGATEGAGEAAEHGASSSVVASMLASLRLRSVPATVAGSFIIFYTWLITVAQMTFAAEPLSRWLPIWLVGIAAMVLAFIVALPLTSLSARPLARFFVIHQAPGRATLLGKVCEVTTGSVSTRFGQARVREGGDVMLVQVRCDAPNTLKRGRSALIVTYDLDRGAFIVEPYDEVLGQKE